MSLLRFWRSLLSCMLLIEHFSFPISRDLLATNYFASMLNLGHSGRKKVTMCRIPNLKKTSVGLCNLDVFLACRIDKMCGFSFSQSCVRKPACLCIFFTRWFRVPRQFIVNIIVFASLLPHTFPIMTNCFDVIRESFVFTAWTILSTIW